MHFFRWWFYLYTMVNHHSITIWGNIFLPEDLFATSHFVWWFRTISLNLKLTFEQFFGTNCGWFEYEWLLRTVVTMGLNSEIAYQPPRISWNIQVFELKIILIFLEAWSHQTTNQYSSQLASSCSLPARFALLSGISWTWCWCHSANSSAKKWWH